MGKIHELAAEGKTQEIIEFLESLDLPFKGTNLRKWSELINEPNGLGEGLHPLHYAAQGGNTKTVTTLIELGAKINITDKYNATPLHYSATYNHTDTTKTLVSKGANIEAKGRKGKTPLHYAAQNGRTETVCLLIALDADVAAKDIDGKTPLHYAAERSYVKIITALIAKGGDNYVNMKDNEGGTSLYRAAQFYMNTANGSITYLLSIPNIQINEIGPQSLLSFYSAYTTERVISSLLRSKGVLEHRTTNTNGTVNYNARGQSIHSARTEETVKQTFENLMQAHNPGNNSTIIEKAYADFQDFLKSNKFSTLAKEISENPNGFGSDAALHAAVNALKPNERYNILMRDIPGIIQRVNNPANSQDVKDNFKKAISLVWLTLQQDEGWEALKGLMTEDEKAIERHRLMLTFIKGLFDIQHEYFNEGNSLKDAPHAACAPGTVNHTLAIFSQQHDKILVTDIEPTPVYDPNSPIKEQLMADDYQRLIEILKTSFREGFKDLEEALSGSSQTIPLLTKEMIDSFFRPNYTNEVTEERPTLIPEHRKLLESLLGKVKEQFYTQLDAFNVPNNPRIIIDAFIGLEDALDQMPVQRLTKAINTITGPSTLFLFSENYNRLIPANIRQAYYSCQTTPAYVEDILDKLQSNSIGQRVNLFKEALKAYPEYSNESWFTSLSEKHKQTINQLIKNQIIFIKKTI